MSILLDSGIVYAYYDRSDAWHERARTLIADERGGLVLPALVIPEVDHLLRHRLGTGACRTFYEGLTNGSYVIADLPHERLARVVELNLQYPDLGFVDATLATLAEVRKLPRIATSDRRHFLPLAGPLGLEILP